MRRLDTLVSQLEALKKEATTWLDGAIAAAQGESRGLSAEEEAKQKDYAKRIADSEKLIEAERALEALRAAPAVTPIPNAGKVTTDGIPNAAKDRKFGFANIAEFAHAVRSHFIGGPLDARLQAVLQAAPTTYHQEQGQTEGVMVPPDFRADIWALVFGDPVLKLLQIEPTSSNVVQFVKDETTPWGASGVQAYWRAEAGQMTPSKLATKLEQVPIHSLYAFALTTDELLDDAPRLASRLTTKASAAIIYKMVEAFMWGDGVGKPIGWMNSPALITQTKESGQSASTIVVANVFKMLSRVPASELAGSFWAANPDTIPQLGQLSIGYQPVWLNPAPNGDEPSMISGIPAMFLGRPIVFSEHCQSLTTKGDIQLIAPQGYAAYQRSNGIQADTSIHLYFDYHIQAFRWTVRVGGAPILSAAISAAKGSNSKGHFVCIENR